MKGIYETVQAEYSISGYCLFPDPKVFLSCFEKNL